MVDFEFISTKHAASFLDLSPRTLEKYRLTGEGPVFYSAEKAREWIFEQKNNRSDTNWDYEIGVNCKPFKNTDVKVCEETIK